MNVTQTQTHLVKTNIRFWLKFHPVNSENHNAKNNMKDILRSKHEEHKVS